MNLKPCKMFLFLLLILGESVWAGCSPYMGLATINEVSRQNLLFNSNNDFIEIKKLDEHLSDAVLPGWKLQICDVVLIIFQSCSPQYSLGDATQIGDYWVYSGNPDPSSYIDWVGGFDILLTDENGDVIDHLSVNGVNFLYENCPYPYPTTASGFLNTRRAFRKPDGVGDWDVPFGNTVPPTQGATNNDNPPPADAPQLTFLQDVQVAQGATAILTMQLDSTYTSDVIINYATINGEASAGTDYVSSSGTVTIPAGSLSIDVSVDTLITGNPIDSFFYLTIQDASNADVIDQVAKITILQGVTADHFEISHAGVGITCEPSTVTITAKDASNQTITNYTGVLQISTSTSHGDWSLLVGNGNFSAGGSDSGDAQYEMVLADAGTVNLALANTHIEILNIHLLDDLNVSETTGSASASDDEDIHFQQAMFRFLYDDGVALSQSMPLLTSHKPAKNSGNNDALLVRAISTDINTGECVATLTGNQSIDLALECVNPSACDNSTASRFLLNGSSVPENSGSVVSYSSHTLNFSLGSALLPNVIYQDSGQVKLYARKNINGVLVSGSSNGITVIPAGFCMQISDANDECVGVNDSQWASCSVFKTAGETFSANISAQGWQNDGDSNFCDNNARTRSFNHTVDLSPSLIAPSGGSIGSINVSQVTLASGQVTSNFTWSEVGVMAFIMGGNSYLSASLPTSTSEHIGRWIPARFQLTKLNDGQFDSANNGFTYVGQLTSLGDGAMGYGTLPQYEFEARNALAIPTVVENYIGDFYKNPVPTLSNSVSTLGADAATQLTLNSQFFNHTFTYQSGSSSYLADFNSSDHFYIERETNSLIAPFTLDAQIALSTFADSDNVTGNSLNFNIAGSPLRYGRLRVLPAFGPETSAILQTIQAEYFDGSLFQVNTLDDNTSVDIAEIVNITVSNEGNDSNPLQVGDSNASGESFDIGTLSSGRWTISWSSPSNNRYGEYEFDYNAPAWLEFNWDESGDESEEGPSSAVTFGNYRGHDNIIYWREIY